ncbi:hypothetical protein [Streptomyces sp. NBC_00847]|uniref:hypothetical protein n=1 Tax=Streptomyces sp. NBC_00847 TaxID=2975850 RepID=UPI00225E2F35|nr:hypothetical protein [Streptomyces sp. NBC_00847]MCX4885888.1 hypothetical protein [Streptomyces sp. NBC_00847]
MARSLRAQIGGEAVLTAVRMYANDVKNGRITPAQAREKTETATKYASDEAKQAAVDILNGN